VVFCVLIRSDRQVSTMRVDRVRACRVVGCLLTLLGGTCSLRRTRCTTVYSRYSLLCTACPPEMCLLPCSDRNLQTPHSQHRDCVRNRNDRYHTEAGERFRMTSIRQSGSIWNRGDNASVCREYARCKQSISTNKCSTCTVYPAG
jgi:hypothetical protein